MEFLYNIQYSVKKQLRSIIVAYNALNTLYLYNNDIILNLIQ